MARTFGSLVFLTGLVIAIVFGVITGLMPTVISGSSGLVLVALILLGFISGLSIMKHDHLTHFLVAVIAIALVGGITVQQLAGLFPQAGAVISIVFQNIVAFLAPAALVAGLVDAWSFGYAKDKK